MKNSTNTKKMEKVVSTACGMINIPQEFRKALKFGNQAVCAIHDGMMIVRPLKVPYDKERPERALAEIMTLGVSDENILGAFRTRRLNSERVSNKSVVKAKEKEKTIATVKVVVSEGAAIKETPGNRSKTSKDKKKLRAAIQSRIGF